MGYNDVFLSHSQLMSIPCNIIVPGNQRKAPNVYSLTECYYATVCIDQPVAADAIAPPPEQYPVGSADPGSPAPAPARSGADAPKTATNRTKDDGFPEPAPTYPPKAGETQPPKAEPAGTSPATNGKCTLISS